jgi:hypothetical protein
MNIYVVMMEDKDDAPLAVFAKEADAKLYVERKNGIFEWSTCEYVVMTLDGEPIPTAEEFEAALLKKKLAREAREDEHRFKMASDPVYARITESLAALNQRLQSHMFNSYDRALGVRVKGVEDLAGK